MVPPLNGRTTSCIPRARASRSGRGRLTTASRLGDLNGQLGTFALLPQVVQAVDLPVIAAGGIADARGAAAALALGAAGVQVGTAYLLCPECSTSAVHRAALQSEAAATTALTTLYSGRPARGIVNDANDWAVETMGNPKYPLELFQRVVTVSLETNRIVAGLPKLDI